MARIAVLVLLSFGAWAAISLAADGLAWAVHTSLLDPAERAKAEQQEADRLAENKAVVKAFDENASACAENYNTAVQDAARLLAVQPAAAAPSVQEQQEMHTLNHQVVSSMRCLLAAAEWMLPGSDAGETQVATSAGVLPVGLLILPFASPVYEDNPIENLVCPGETLAPRSTAVQLAVEAGWWQSTESRLAGVGEPEIGFAFDTHMTLRDRVVQPGSGLWPVIDSTGQGRAWLTFDTDSRRVTVNPPSPLAVESYCADLAADR